MGKFRVGVDIGGTFTDLVAFDERAGGLTSAKVPSTPERPADGVVEAFGRFLEVTGPDEIVLIMHATTVATNAILGQTGLELPKTALVTTLGFKDVLEIGRQKRPELYNLFAEKPRPLIPRKYRYEVEERIDSNGREITPLNLEAVREITAELREETIDAVAIGLLSSYVNPAHEKEIKRVLKRELPRAYLTASHEISPEYREYERMSTVAVNAVLMPIVSRYVRELAEKIGRLSISAPIHTMKSDGGVASEDTILSLPATMIESGPTAGVIGSAFYGSLLGIARILSFDMGGTTAKAGLVKDGRPEIAPEYEVGAKTHSGRTMKGSGYPVRLPFVDLAECSAGGGTIAWVDGGGALRVGPTSAGARPGPACYGAGGGEPTVTDANLILGRLNPEDLLGGKMKIEKELARETVEEKICRRVGLSPTEAAVGIIRIVNSQMAKILRMVSMERGHDPRRFTLMAFGGAGPIHSCALAEELGIPCIVVPVNPGLFSALGLLAADFRRDFLKTVLKDGAGIEARTIERAFRNLENEGRSFLDKEQVDAEDMVFVRQLDMRYSGQAYELTVPAAKPFTARSLIGAVDDFHCRHEAVCGYAAEKEPVEFVNVRLTAIGVVTKPKLKEEPSAGKKPVKESILTRRECFFEKYGGWVKTPVYVREDLEPLSVVEGPAIVEQYDATTVVYPEWRALIDRFGNIRMERI